VLAVAVASLGLVSGASARLMPEDGSGVVAAPAPVPVIVTAAEGFDWGSALAGAAVAIGAAAAIGTAAYVVRGRSRLAT
jgi:hypothetical protein